MQINDKKRKKQNTINETILSEVLHGRLHGLFLCNSNINL